MNDKRIDKKLAEEIITYLKSVIANYDMILVADFGHGLMTPGMIQFLEGTGKFIAVNAQTNSNNYGFAGK